MGDRHPALEDIVTTARRMLALERVLLFGSRARGDARSESDLDIAIEHNSGEDAWANFVCQVQESAPTLLDVDLVDLRKVDAKFRKRIENEGVLLYG